jgi:hypothetical protein
MAAAILGAGVIQAYIGYVTLPDDFTGYCVAGIAIGLAVGQRTVFLAALPSALLYSGYAIEHATPENSLWEVVWFVYVPAAVLSLAIGLVLRIVAVITLQRSRS